ncbi:hypothetical protein FHG87_006715 [Trinorchestia longiramus]|nr:hypothetical protein FHG87_006715 [Trinorchestia longiramus]
MPSPARPNSERWKGGSVPSNEHETRTYFPETWLWQFITYIMKYFWNQRSELDHLCSQARRGSSSQPPSRPTRP